ncbi:hypothetical protein F8M41_009277 [Gigaspora margarita]|uniref:Uncharacterized protein n=1 Tax=Gigaspora margarita TaxID=4874 RepID=A0A8H4B5W1_GIGMA|nr:hypothetical protein F8M41_009277 [Gigaspora margarita]
MSGAKKNTLLRSENYITKQLSKGFKSQNEELHEQITRLKNELKNLSSTSSDEPRHTIGSNESKNVKSKLKVEPQNTELDQLRKDNTLVGTHLFS